MRAADLSEKRRDAGCKDEHRENPPRQSEGHDKERLPAPETEPDVVRARIAVSVITDLR